MGKQMLEEVGLANYVGQLGGGDDDEVGNR
jgi:hypothetical protein